MKKALEILETQIKQEGKFSARRKNKILKDLTEDAPVIKMVNVVFKTSC